MKQIVKGWKVWDYIQNNLPAIKDYVFENIKEAMDNDSTFDSFQEMIESDIEDYPEFAKYINKYDELDLSEAPEDVIKPMFDNYLETVSDDLTDQLGEVLDDVDFSNSDWAYYLSSNIVHILRDSYNLRKQELPYNETWKKYYKKSFKFYGESWIYSEVSEVLSDYIENSPLMKKTKIIKACAKA